ncbi:MAG TPA: hypothetical protein IGS52_15170 [Oscillatoriaceae cyanobacterium M33_DOE_052]|uniref:Uncharacterized protein n=1 Tax=Planktothricoides sp. SpSt-374 TaxID=2282167 RepID=A0A7C3ZNL6_9CYAN|nr:hypothetical protein [Oscillatoriaceae cyanobacterium M33_DOE_052]
MYVTYRAAVVRNLALAIANGTITLIILLIAPLGLAAVITNTFLVTAASFFSATIIDSVMRYLEPKRVQEIDAGSANFEQPIVRSRQGDDIERR